jgi:pimeloyl-ACP methyl ester carboxylesterase
MRTTTMDGATIGWTDAGSGDVSVLLHAGAFGAWFAPLAERLPGRVIRVLRAGYAGGAVPPDLIDVAGHAAHTAALLEALDAAPATVVGHSSGSAIALQLALDRPDLVSRLVLSEPPLVDVLLDPVDVDEVQAMLGAAMGAAMQAWGRGDVPTAFHAFMAAVCGPGYRSVLEDVLGPEGLARAERDADFFFANEVPAFGRWVPGDLDRVASPVLLVQGAASPAPTHRVVTRLATALPDARVGTIQGANHLLPLTHPAELAHLVTSGSGGLDTGGRLATEGAS